MNNRLCKWDHIVVLRDDRKNSMLVPMEGIFLNTIDTMKEYKRRTKWVF